MLKKAILDYCADFRFLSGIYANISKSENYRSEILCLQAFQMRASYSICNRIVSFSLVRKLPQIKCVQSMKPENDSSLVVSQFQLSSSFLLPSSIMLFTLTRILLKERIFLLQLPVQNVPSILTCQIASFCMFSPPE